MTAAVRSRRVPAKWVRGAIGVVVLFLVLEAVTRAELVTPDYLPPASSILRETFDLLTDPSFLGDVWVTLQACLIGLAIAMVVAVPLGLVLGLTDDRLPRHRRGDRVPAADPVGGVDPARHPDLRAGHSR